MCCCFVTLANAFKSSKCFCFFLKCVKCVVVQGHESELRPSGNERIGNKSTQQKYMHIEFFFTRPTIKYLPCLMYYLYCAKFTVLREP